MQHERGTAKRQMGARTGGAADRGVARRSSRAGVTVWAGLAIWVVLAATLAGCRSTATPPTLPSGSYRNATYHVQVAYPDGWQVNVTPEAQASVGIPLHVVITRTGALQTQSTLVTNWSLTVMNGKVKNIDEQIAALRRRIQQKDASLHPLTLGGASAYQEQPVRQTIPGSQVTDTHTTYYLLVGDLEYEISTDALSSDHAEEALQSILSSFTLLP